MIQKVRELMAVSDEISVIKNNVQYAASAVSELKEQVDAAKNALREHDENFREQTQALSRDLSKQLESIRGMQKEFEKELFAFKLLKAQLQTKIMEKFEQELHSELQMQMQLLKADSEQYAELREELKQLSLKVGQTCEHIDKFNHISQHIKKSDFELVNHARQLHQMDREKLELMRKIDTLERLISRMRRQEILAR